MTIRVLSMRDDEAAGLSPDERAGLGALATPQGNLPLEAVDVAVQITGLAARTRLSQVFGNPYDVPLEATYIFPLPDRAAVTGMRMEAADRVVEGVLKERQQARDEYDRALAAGQRAAIAEEERPDVFTMRVGNIAPGERVTVRLTLDGELPYEDGAATYRFPLVVAPRYIPGSPIDGPVGDGVAPDTDAVPDASRITPPVLLPGFPNPVRLGIAVELDLAGPPIRDIRSSLHQVTVTESDAVARIELGIGQRLDRDFVLRWRPRAADTAVTPVLTLAPDDAAGEGTFQLTLFPPHLPDAGRPRDVALVLDRSGSMSGWKMVAARRAAARIVDSLGSGDRFAVLGFDTVVERPAALTEGLADASDRHRFRAVEFLARLEARGGTELLSPLRESLGLLRETPGRDRVLVLVTDGQVGNEDQILRELSPELASVRVHTVGIDQAVNAGFLGRLAVVGGGRCELVESEDRLDEAMDLIHRRIGTPVVTGLRLEAPGFDIDQVSPSRLPDLHPGTALRICGRYRGTPGRINVTGQRPDGEPWQVSVPATTVDNPALAAVWARGRLRDLEDRYAAAADPRQRESLEREIVATSLRFQVLCRFTAYVAIDSRAGESAGEPHRVVQPVEMPAGWQMLAAVSPQPVPASPAMLRTAGAPQIAPAAFILSGPTPVRGITAAGTADAAVDMSTVLATELRRLEDLAEVAPALRWAALADLSSRLRALAGQLPESERQALLRIAESLAVCDGPLPRDLQVLERLWRQTLTELDRYVAAKAKSRPGIRRGRFWKR